MFSKLPEIFGRDFVIGYFLPSAVFLAVSIPLTGAKIPIIASSEGGVFKNAVLFGLISWFGGIILLAINRSLVRAIEGYGTFNPARLFQRIERNRFEILSGKISAIESKLDACGTDGNKYPPELLAQRSALLRQAAERFPDGAIWLLPTGFGNTIRAFEVYSRVVYGYESTYGWSRLIAVVPKEYRELLDESKAQMDFWVNISFLSALVLVECLAFHNQGLTNSSLIISAALSLSSISYVMAKDAALAWGDSVKAAFDVFLPDLRKKMEFPFPASKNEERELWTGFSESILFRLPAGMPDRVQELKSKP